MHDHHSKFTVEPLYLFHIDISKKLKECIAANLSDEAMCVVRFPSLVQNKECFR